MSQPKFDLIDRPAVDTLTNKMMDKSVFIVSGARSIFLGVETIQHLVNFLKTKNIVVKPND